MFSSSGQMFNNYIQLYIVVGGEKKRGGEHSGRIKSYLYIQICSETADALSTPTQLLFIALALPNSSQQISKRNSSKDRTVPCAPPTAQVQLLGSREES